MKLRDVLRGVASCDDDAEVTWVTADSRLVTPGALFVAIPGLQTDGAKFIAQAVEKGAVAVVSGAAGFSPPSGGLKAAAPLSRFAFVYTCVNSAPKSRICAE